jgi:hypothetical protein
MLMPDYLYIMKAWVISLFTTLSGLVLSAGEIAQPKFRPVEIDSKIEIGYGVVVADVDGDKKPDILLADKKQIVWYRNPTWEKFVIAENLTKLDNVCIAAADIDGDGKAEIAVGAGWNPGDTVGSGAVFYLIPPKDRTQRWEAVELPHEPTVHRMKWMRKDSGKYQLVVAPLHGRGNRDGEGAGVKILAYEMPANPREPWSTKVLNDSWHLTHNFELKRASGTSAPDELLVACKEGVFELQNGSSRVKQLTGKQENGFQGAGEVRLGKLPGKFVATIEPMHGHQVVVYTAEDESNSSGFWRRNIIDHSLKEGHALACGDLLGTGSDQIVAGWRGKDVDGKTGIRLYTATDKEGKGWRTTTLDDNGIACEDLCLADLNGDGKLDIIASGRSTKNVKIYFNERD